MASRERSTSTPDNAAGELRAGVDGGFSVHATGHCRMRAAALRELSTRRPGSSGLTGSRGHRRRTWRTLQSLAQRPEFTEPAVDLFEMLRERTMDFLAPVGTGGGNDQFSNFGEREAERPSRGR